MVPQVLRVQPKSTNDIMTFHQEKKENYRKKVLLENVVIKEFEKNTRVDRALKK